MLQSEIEMIKLFFIALSACLGALAGIGTLGYWMASKFNNIYTRMSLEFKIISQDIAEHEIEDERRFSQLKLDILNSTIQAQSAQLKHRGN